MPTDRKRWAPPPLGGTAGTCHRSTSRRGGRRPGQAAAGSDHWCRDDGEAVLRFEPVIGSHPPTHPQRGGSVYAPRGFTVGWGVARAIPPAAAAAAAGRGYWRARSTKKEKEGKKRRASTVFFYPEENLTHSPGFSEAQKNACPPPRALPGESAATHRRGHKRRAKSRARKVTTKHTDNSVQKGVQFTTRDKISHEKSIRRVSHSILVG